MFVREVGRAVDVLAAAPDFSIHAAPNTVLQIKRSYKNLQESNYTRRLKFNQSYAAERSGLDRD